MKKRLSMLILAGAIGCMQVVPVQGEVLYTSESQEAERLSGANSEALRSSQEVSLYVNKKKVENMQQSPAQIEGRVLVPIREVFEAMGATVHWNGPEKKVTVKYKQQTVVLTVDKKQALVNGKIHELDVPAKVINGKVMIPVRFVSEALKMTVQWDSKNRAVWIEEPVVKPPVSEGNNGVKDQIYAAAASIHELDLPSGSYGKTSITEIKAAEQNGVLAVEITASSPIPQTKMSFLLGKLVIDLPGSLNKLSSVIGVADNSYISNIRTSQFTADTTRIVLDQKSGAAVKAKYSADRTKLQLELKSENLQQITVSKSGEKDVIFFKGISSSQITITESTNQIDFQLLNMKLDKNIYTSVLNSSYITAFTANQTAGGIKGTIKLSQKVSSTFENTETGTKLILTGKISSQQPGNTMPGETVNPGSGNQNNNTETPQGMTYLSGSRPVITLAQITGLSAGSITVKDNYRDRQLVFDLGKNYSKILPDQVKTINDKYIKNIKTETSGTTKITVNTQKIYACNIKANGSKVELQLMAPGEKYDKIVVVDIGHGGSDGGAAANGLKEKDINFNQGMALFKLLENDPDIKVYMTREQDVYPTLSFRTTLANEIGADLFVSLHNNSAGSAVKGTETLYYPSATDQRGKQIAQLIQNNIVGNCNMINRGIKPRTDLHVLNATQMPAVLIETGFITNAEEAVKINSPEFIKKWAQGVYSAIVRGFEIL